MKLAKIAFACVAAVSISAVADDYSNTVAILPVEKALNAMPLTVNFTDANGNALSADKVVKTAGLPSGLPSGSALYVYDGVSAYTKFDLSGTAWVPTNDGKKYVVDSTGQLVVTNAAAASDVTVARGAAVFLETPSTFSGNFYVAGTPVDYDPNTPGSGTTTTISEGANLIGAPTAAAFDLNSNTATWTGIAESTFTSDAATAKISAIGDAIEVPTGDGGVSTTYYYRKGTGWNCWGYFVKSGRSSTFTTTGCEIPAGRGFWYIRKASAGSMTIRW